MYIHIGPVKTGTTSIQDFLSEHSASLLENDHTEFLWKWRGGDVIRKVLLNCVMITPEVRCSKQDPASWSDLLNNTSIPARNGRNLIISGEDFAYSDFGSINWKDFLDYHRLQYTIRFVMCYRRYFDWLPSDYNQHYKMRGQYSKKELEPWPNEENGVTPRTFPSYYMNRRPDPRDQHKRNYENKTTGQNTNMVLVLSNTIKELGYPVRIFNFHDGDVVKSFVCDMVLVTHTCEVVKSSSDIIRKNTSKEFNVDLLAVAIKDSGLVQTDSTLSKEEMKQIVLRRFRYRPKWTGFPLVCLEGKGLEEFRRNSYEAEKVLMPTMLGTHDKAFQKVVEENKFCSIDAPRFIREDEGWRSYVKLEINS